MSAATAKPLRSYRGKRTLDLVVVLLSAPLVLPLVAVSALLVKCTSRGPVLFWQERIGGAGRAFLLPKLRTMVDAPGGNPVIPDAQCITAVGRWLRRLSLDELPQLLSIARGDMSVVGPRPTLAYQVERYDERQRGRLAARPGLTGLAQVRGRNGISWADRIEYDLQYIEEQSLWLDLRIMLATVATVLRRAGVDGHAADDPLSVPPP